MAQRDPLWHLVMHPARSTNKAKRRRPSRDSDQGQKVTEHSWRQYIAIFVRIRNCGWVKGKVKKVVNNPNLEGVDYRYAIGVLVPDEREGNSDEWVEPSTWTSRPQEIPDLRIRDFVCAVDPFQESLSSGAETYIYKALKLNRSCKIIEPTESVSAIDQLLLGDNKEFYLQNQILRLTKSKDVAMVKSHITGSTDKVTVFDALAWLVGQVAGAELQRQNQSRFSSKYKGRKIWRVALQSCH